MSRSYYQSLPMEHYIAGNLQSAWNEWRAQSAVQLLSMHHQNSSTEKLSPSGKNPCRVVLLILNAQIIPLPRDTVSVMKVCAELAVAKNQTLGSWLKSFLCYPVEDLGGGGKGGANAPLFGGYSNVYFRIHNCLSRTCIKSSTCA